MQIDMREEQWLSVELHAVRNTDVRYKSAWAIGLNRLLHCLLCPNTLQHRVDTDPLGQLLDSSNAFVTALGDDVGCAKFARELLSGLVAAQFQLNHFERNFGPIDQIFRLTSVHLRAE